MAIMPRERNPMPKREIKPVYAVVGEDVFLQLQALATVREAMPADASRTDVDGESAGLADTLDELRSPSLFGGHKLVVVRSADEFITKYREQLEDYVGSPSDSGTLVLRCASLPKNQRIYKAIAKAGEVIDCAPPKQGELPGWVMRRAREAHGLTMGDDAARVLADLIGADLGRIDNELAKLALQTDGKAVRPEDVGRGVAFQREQEMWEMTDALTVGQVDEALRRWRHLVASDPSSEFRAVTWLAIWVEKALRAVVLRRQKMNAFAIGKELKIWPAQNAEKLIATAERLGEGRLRGAVERLLDVDRRNKSSLGEPARNVESFLLSLA